MTETKTTISNEFLSDYFRRSGDIMNSLIKDIPIIERMACGIYNSQVKGGKLLICGNGGSSADADHFAGEMTCTFSDPERQPFSAISLNSCSSAITAWSNDFDFDSFLSRQVEALGCTKDVLFLISTGGGNCIDGISMNMVNAAETGLKMGLKVYSIVGKTGGEIYQISHESIKVSSFTTSHIQEAHIAIIHVICLILDIIDRSNRGK